MPKQNEVRTFIHARELRQNLTDAEKKLWLVLRAHQMGGVQFRRQHAIGPYIVDFCSPRRKLIIEVDGGQHAEQKEYDAERTAFLGSKGYRVLRFWNHEVLGNFEAVTGVIFEAVSEMG